MNLFSFDLRILILFIGLPLGICSVLKEYQTIKTKPYKRCFFFYVLAVLFFEVDMVWGIISMCSGSLSQVKHCASYMSLILALACFSFSGYVISDNVLNGDVTSEDKLEAKLAIGVGIYFTVVTIVSLLS